MWNSEDREEEKEKIEEESRNVIKLLQTICTFFLFS
jgi:hypothetical protein